MIILIVSFIFISTALVSAVLIYPAVSRKTALKDRLDRLSPQREEQTSLVPTPEKWQTILGDLGRRVSMKPKELFKYREMWVNAGFKVHSLHVFLGSKVLLAIALPAAYLFLFAMSTDKGFGSGTFLGALICVIAGFLLPTFWLRRRITKRKTEIFHTLPDVLDLLTVCVEAGLGLDAAFIKTAENFNQVKNPLIDEIQQVTREVRAGVPRSEALKGMAMRTAEDDIRSFVAMLIQTEKFGTSLGKTLRAYSDSLRIKRRQLAEEAAAKTGTKMLFPLVVCIFPALLIVLLVPAFFRMITMFGKM